MNKKPIQKSPSTSNKSPQSKSAYEAEEAKEKKLIKKGDLGTLAKMHKNK